MIKVTRFYSKEELVGLEVRGHANSDEYGKDLVCAGVSSILIGGFNALVKSEIDEVTLEEGYAKVMIKEDSNISKIVLNVIETQLLTIEESYPKNIKIK